MSKAIVFASFTPKSESVLEVERILSGMVPPTRNEAGCEAYDLFRTSDEPLTFHIFEVYRDRAALEAHRDSAHYKAYRGEIMQFLADPIFVKVLTAL